jgi:dTMP kinase
MAGMSNFRPLPREELVARGYCCGMGCRYCPYEPAHTYGVHLLANKENKYMFPAKPHGKFITFEGIDGSGKSSVLSAVQKYLTISQIPCLTTRQPGGSPLGEQVREVLKNPQTRVGSITEVLLFAASFHECWNTLIYPSLSSGTWVLCDRWTDSTLAYQCGGRGLSENSVREILHAAAPIEPDLTIFCSTLPETAAHRISERGATDRFEAEGLVLQKSVHGYYLQKTCKESRVHIVDTDRLDELAAAEKTIHIIEQLFSPASPSSPLRTTPTKDEKSKW